MGLGRQQKACAKRLMSEAVRSQVQAPVPELSSNLVFITSSVNLSLKINKTFFKRNMLVWRTQ